MTVQIPTIVPQACSSGIQAPVFGYQIVWPTMANGDSGAPGLSPGPSAIDLIPWLDRTFQVEGTFGVGGTLLVEGSNDGVHWETLTNPQGTPISITAAGIWQVTEVVMQMRPRVSGGDGSTALNVTAFYRRTST
jgi:hypothetical protein